MIDSFEQRKRDMLSKIDKSFIGEWDKKIIPLCEKINSKDNFYTTSSCSGRIVLIIDQDVKEAGLFIKVWHDLVFFPELKEALENITKKDLIKFKVEPPILHIACRNLESASELLEKAKHIGFKRSGINALGKNIILELNSTERIEFPILNNGKILVDDEFLKIIVKQANEKMKKSWKKIDELKKLI
jgi:tRNA wybutosine-synthesizing protein 3